MALALAAAGLAAGSSAYGARQSSRDAQRSAAAYENSPDRMFQKKMIGEASRLYDKGPGELLGARNLDTTVRQQNALGAQSQLAGSGLVEGIGNQMMGYGQGAMGGGGQAQQYYQNTMSQGGPQMDFGMAGQFANNPYLNQQIQGAQRDVGRNLYEQQLPGVRAGAAAAGQVGSSRRGAYEAITQRGAQDRMSDISAQMRGQAYSQGLQQTQQQQQFGAKMKQDAAFRATQNAQAGLGNMQGGAQMLYNNAAYNTQLAGADYDQQNLNYGNRRFEQEERNNQALTHLQNYNNLSLGAGVSQSGPPVQPNAWQVAGGMGADLAGSFANQPQQQTPNLTTAQQPVSYQQQSPAYYDKPW